MHDIWNSYENPQLKPPKQRLGLKTLALFLVIYLGCD